MLVGSFIQEKALIGAFSMITNLRVDLRLKLYWTPTTDHSSPLYRYISHVTPPIASSRHALIRSSWPFLNIIRIFRSRYFYGCRFCQCILWICNIFERTLRHSLFILFILLTAVVLRGGVYQLSNPFHVLRLRKKRAIRLRDLNFTAEIISAGYQECGQGAADTWRLFVQLSHCHTGTRGRGKTNWGHRDINSRA